MIVNKDYKLFVLFIIVLSFSVINVKANKNSRDTLITKKDIVEDISYLKNTLEAIHPDLYNSYSEADFTKSLDSLISIDKNEISVNLFKNQLARIVALLNDGHTGTSTEIFNKKPTSYFPVKIDLKSHNICLDRTNTIRKGAKIISINSVKIEDIIEQIYPYLWGDTYRFKMALLEYEFPVQLWRNFGWQGEFAVKYSFQGKSYNKVIKGSQIATFYNYYGDVEGHFDIIKEQNENFGFLKLSEFEASKDYFRFIDDCFTKLNKDSVENLVIDIRDNGGGNSVLADYIFQYITERPYCQCGSDSIIVKYSKPVRSFFRKYSFKKPYFLPFMLFMPEYWKARGTKVYKNKQVSSNLKEEVRYKGNVYLITSNFCFSTADDFARVFKYYNMGTIIGKETGGIRDSFGDFVLFSLPNSKIQCSCSRKYFKGLNLNDNAKDGVKPDYELDCKDYSEEQIIQTIIDLKNK